MMHISEAWCVELIITDALVYTAATVTHTHQKPRNYYYRLRLIYTGTGRYARTLQVDETTESS